MMVWLSTLLYFFCIQLDNFVCCPVGYDPCNLQNIGTCPPNPTTQDHGEVAFGTDFDGVWTYKSLSIGTLYRNCTVTEFGDPSPGNAKECCITNLSDITVAGNVVGEMSCGDTTKVWFRDEINRRHWKLTTTQSNDITYYGCNTGFDSTTTVYNSSLAVISNTECSPNIDDFGNDCGSCSSSTAEEFTLINQDAGVYWIRIGYFDATSAPGNKIYELTITCNPNTVSPTTVAPTTYTPTTSDPTTAAPTTGTPTTATPTTIVPTTAIPTTTNPTTDTPTTAIPTTTNPTTYTPSSAVPTTFSPTKYPSHIPSNSPSQYPSKQPWCIWVLEILTGVTTNEFANDDELLLFTMNNTKFAIYNVVRNSYKYDISVLCVDFWRCFFLTVTDINSDSGTMINFDVCAWKENVYNALLDKMESDGDEMEAFMVQQLKSYLMSIDDSITVSIVIKQTHGQVVTTLSSSNIEQIAGDNSDESSESLQFWITLTVIVVILLLVGLVIAFYLFCYKQFKNRNVAINNMNKSNHVAVIETGSPVAVQMERINSDEGMSLDNNEIGITQAVNKTDMGICDDDEHIIQSNLTTMGNDVIIDANTPEHEQTNNNDENVSILKPPLIVSDFGNTEGNGDNYVDVKNKNKNNKGEDDTAYL